MNTASWKADEELTLEAENGQRRYKLIRRLGGGKTSVVWLAEPLDSSMAPESSQAEVEPTARKTEEVALKALHTATESQWRGAFEDEIDILRTLAESKLQTVPKLFDVSKQEASPAFMTMEYVDYPSAQELAKPEYWLNETLQKMVKSSDSLSYQARLLKEQVSRLSDGQPALLASLESILANLKPIEEKLQELEPATKKWDEAHKGLAELEVVQIGIQVCQVLQQLHESGRGYRDFQLQNIRWSRDSKQVKIIDWNVVTNPGSISIDENRGLELIQKDLTILAINLFYLRTLVLPPKSASADVLRHYGGELWQRSSDLLKMVLEKALNPKEESRFKWAYQSKEDSDSLGAALEKVSTWLAMDAEALVREAEGLESKDDWVLALCQLAEDKLKQRGGAYETGLTERIVEQKEQVTSAGSDLRTLENFVTATSYTDARKVLANISEKSLMHQRWQYVLGKLVQLKGELRDRDRAIPLLLQGMGALETRKWTLAEKHFQELGQVIGDAVDFPEKLQMDAAVGAKLQQVEWEWIRLQAILPQYSGQPFLKEPAERILSSLLEIEGMLGVEHKPTDYPTGSENENGGSTNAPAHPYAMAIWEAWPDCGTWHETANKVVQDVDNPNAEANQVTDNLRQADTLEKQRQALEQGLMKLPGNDILLNHAFELTKGKLENGRPEEALPFLELCLRYAGSSVYFGELWRCRQLAADWLQLRESVGTDHSLAKVLVSRLIESMRNDDVIRRRVFEELVTKRLSRQGEASAAANGNVTQ